MAIKCTICDNEFYENKVDDKGRCVSCAAAYPGATNRAEALAQSTPDKFQETTLNEARVSSLIAEAMANLNMDVFASQVMEKMDIATQVKDAVDSAVMAFTTPEVDENKPAVKHNKPGRPRTIVEGAK